MKDPGLKAKEEKERLIAERQAQIDAAAGKTGDNQTLDADGNPIVAPVVVEPSPVVAPADDLQQKFDTLLAKYNSEVPRLHSWMKEKDEKIALLTSENADLKRQAETPPAPQVDDDGKVLYRSPLVTDEMRKDETYQYYLAEFGQTYAERQAEMAVKAARNTVKPVEEQITANAATTDREKFHAKLHSIAPEWIDLDNGINVDDGFCQWLTASYTQPALQNAYMEFDVQTMANIIAQYKSTIKPPVVPPKREPPSPAPPRVGGGQQTIIDANKGNVMHMSDMEKLHDEFVRGMWRGREAEHEKKKAEFLLAQKEGRLVP